MLDVVQPKPSAMFRQEAIKALNEPAAADLPARIVKAPGWVALMASTAVVAAGLCWGVLGNVSTFVAAQGVLAPTANASHTTSVVATEPGILRAFEVSIGALVKTGDLLAVIDQPQIRQAAEAARRTIAQIESERDQEVGYWSRYLAQQNANLDTQEADLRLQIQSATRQVDARQRILDGELQLAASGISTRVKTAGTQDQLYQAQTDAARTALSLKQIESQRLDLANQRRTALNRFDERLLEANERLAEAERRLRDGGRVLAPKDGIVVAKEMPLDNVVQPGTHLLTIQPDDGVSQGLFFADARDGKRIKPGMKVSVAPSTVEPERFGTIVGKVAWVSSVAQSGQALARQVGNDALARKLAGDDAPIAFGVDLEPDPSTVSGRKWSSQEGPPFKIDPNTLAHANVAVRQAAPVTLVVPALRRFFGVER